MMLAEVRLAKVPQLSPSSLDALCREALKRESDAWPKPGLVTPVDSGSHRDMNHSTFVRSIASLQGCFAEIAAAAAVETPPSPPPLSLLQSIGMRAEARMLAATGGRNTHRGAIFNLGLLTAAYAHRQHVPHLREVSCGTLVAQIWGAALLARPAGRDGVSSSHGELMRTRYGVGGARAEAAGGFPSVYAIGLPTLRTLLSIGVDEETALIGVLLALMAETEDTNLLWRGGQAGLQAVQAAAKSFNSAGGILQAGWRDVLCDMHAWMVGRNLSPGGSADLAAATWLVHQLESHAGMAEAKEGRQ